MSTKAQIVAYINAAMDIYPDKLTISVDKAVRFAMLELNHNEHPNLQGGQTGEYYHLNQAQYEKVQQLTDNGVYLPLAGGTMDVNAVVNLSNGVQTLKIDSTEPSIIYNTPGSANGYAVLTSYALHFEDNTSENADVTKIGLVAQNGSWAGSHAANYITFIDLVNAEEHSIDATEQSINISSTRSDFKGLQYQNDWSANFVDLSLVHKKYIVDNYATIASLASYGTKTSYSMVDNASTTWKQSVTNNVIEIDAANYRIRLDDLAQAFTAYIGSGGAKKTLDISGSSFVGISITGTGKLIALGDWFDNTTPYMLGREKGGTDTDQWEWYSQKGFFIRATSLATTALITGTQGGKVGIKNETPTYDLDITGDVNVTGSYRQAGTVGYLISALGAQSVGAPVLANLRTRTISINGVTVKMVEEL